MKVIPSILFVPFACLLQASAGVPLSGTWTLQQDKSVQLVVDQTENAIQVREVKDGVTKSEYACDTKGKECPANDEGHHAKVSFYFNGPKLVELITKGSDITKRRFTVAQDGSTLSVEVLPMSGKGKNEVLVYTRR